MTDPLSLTPEQAEHLPEAEAAQALAAWVQARRPELPEALSRSTSKVHARLAKKALYQLKSSGVVVVSSSSTAQAPVASPALPAEDFGGVLSAPLGTGERAVFFARPVRGGGLDLYQGILHDEFGVIQLEQGRATRDQWRRRMRELDADTTVKVLRVDWARLKTELGQAYALNRATSTPLPEAAQVALTLLGVEPAASPPPPVPAPQPGDDALAARGAELFEQPEIAQWLPSEADLLALAQGGAPEVVAAAAFTGPVRAAWAQRLWLMAEVFEHHELAAAAQLARAVARTLPHETGPGPFARELYARAAKLPRAPASSALPPASQLPRPLPRPR